MRGSPGTLHMPVLKVSRLGNPVIRKTASPVKLEDILSSEFQSLIDTMVETMKARNGVGLAAPQIGLSKQIAVIEVNQNPRYPGAPAVPLTVLVNPKIISRSPQSVDGWEGCLSIPDLRGIVPRSCSVVCEAHDRSGKSIRIEASDFFARVIQHECDHLEGKVYLDRMTHFRSLTHLAEFAEYWE